MTLTQRVVLSLICAFALVSTPYALAQQTDQGIQQDQQSFPGQQDRMNQDDSLRQDRNTDTDADVNVDSDINQDTDTQDDRGIQDDRDLGTTDDDSENLPATAGGLPILALLGVASLVGARFAKR